MTDEQPKAPDQGDRPPRNQRGRRRRRGRRSPGYQGQAQQPNQQATDDQQNRTRQQQQSSGGSSGQPPRRESRRPRREEERPARIEPARPPHQPARQGGRRDGGQDGGESRRPSQRPPQPRGDRRPERQTAQPAGGLEGPRGKLRIIPLGGVGEIGKNMTVVEYERDLVLLDCGGKFPEEEQRGIDLIIPDISYVKERMRNLRAIVISHGHEDHIGALPYVIPQLRDRAPIPIYGAPLALGFIEKKLLEHRLDKYGTCHAVGSGQRISLGKLSADFIRVTHSIPDTLAIVINSPVGTIIDTADFKFDPTPVMGSPTDERRLRRLGDQGVLALLSDTTRVETTGSTPSERVVLETMDRVIKAARGQVIIATFASNISRIHMALVAAEKYGRKVAVAGRSMEQNSRVALDLGYLAPAEGAFLPLDEILKLPKEKRVLVITGSQGEAAAALARIAAAEHPKIRVGKGDVVLVSATPVPGNEETVARTIDNLFRRGTKVIYSPVDRGVHVSGHASREELRRMLDLIRPKFALPIHGEYRHMVLYRELCQEAGIPAENILLPEIGGVIELTADQAVIRGRVQSGTMLVDRLGEREGGQVTVRTRDNLTEDGLVIVTIVVDRESGKLIAGPDLVHKGLRPELTNGAVKEAERDLQRMLERRSRGEPQYGYLVQRTKEIVGKSLYRRSKSRPMILPVVTEL
ncbi:MAG: ribonuclease J [Thermomicrobiales bacterium]